LKEAKEMGLIKNQKRPLLPVFGIGWGVLLWRKMNTPLITERKTQNGCYYEKYSVRALLRAAMPLPQLTPDEARALVTKHLVNRARSRKSRMKGRHRGP